MTTLSRRARMQTDGVVWVLRTECAPEDREGAVMAGTDDLLTRLARGLAEIAESGLPLPSRLCHSAARILSCDGGAITFAYTRPERVTVAATDEVAQELEDVQDVAGEGPGVEAFTSGRYSRWDLTEEGAPDPRWPLLESSSLAAVGSVVVHALPMVHPSGALGVLTLYQRGSGGDIDAEAGMEVARLVGAALLSDWPADSAGQGPWAQRAEVHQATGMVVAQLGVPEEDALALIRAHAFSHDQSMNRSAHHIVTRQLSFTTTAEHGIEST